MLKLLPVATPALTVLSSRQYKPSTATCSIGVMEPFIFRCGHPRVDPDGPLVEPGFQMNTCKVFYLMRSIIDMVQSATTFCAFSFLSCPYELAITKETPISILKSGQARW